MIVVTRGLNCILAALACLLPVVAVAHHHPREHQSMANAAVGAAALGASAAFDAHGRLWVVSARDGHVLLRHSDDFGTSLSAPVQVNAVAEKIDAQRENRPAVATAPNGRVYVSWVHPLDKKWASQVRFARSLDGGKTFSKPMTVYDDPQGTTHSFAALAVAGNGDVVLAWLDGRDMAAAMAAGKPHHGLAVYYRWSSDHGKSFVSDRQLMDHSCECCRIALARQADGRVAALFRGIFGDNIRDHAYGVLRTDGKPAHWQRATWSGWQIAACPEQGPRLAVGAHGVRHAVWYEASGGPTIWYGQLDPGHHAHHKLKLGGPGASHADVAVAGRVIWVVWNQVSAQGYRLMARVSHDGGTHFAAARPIARSAVAVTSPQLLVHDARAYVAWNTAAGFRLIALGGAAEASP